MLFLYFCTKINSHDDSIIYYNRYSGWGCGALPADGQEDGHAPY